MVAVWEFICDGGTFQRYPGPSMDTIEQAYEEWRTGRKSYHNDSITLTLGQHEYALNFQASGGALIRGQSCHLTISIYLFC